MKIAVLLKKTLDSEAQIYLSEDNKCIDYSKAKFVINPYDEIAIEEAIKLKEKSPSTSEVVVISFSDESCREFILKALAMGADRGLLIKNLGLEEAPSSVIARVLSSALKHEKPDVIFCGKLAIDDSNMQVGLMVAEYLGIPSVSSISKFSLSEDKQSCVVEKMSDGGNTEVYEIMLPALLGTDRALNQPRYASLAGIMKAKKKTLEVKTVEDFALSTQELHNSFKLTEVEYFYPNQKKSGHIIQECDVNASVSKLIELLRDEAHVL